MATRADPVSLGVVGREEGNPRRGANPNHPTREGLPDGVVPFLCYIQACNACGVLRVAPNYPKPVMVSV